jgi:hypothetical protein
MDNITINKEKLEKFLNSYVEDFPKRLMSDGNRYEECRSCGCSVPEINYRILNHYSWCSWMQQRLTQIFLESLEEDEDYNVED